MKKKLLTIGLMSGTSLDGVDAALILTDGINDIKIIDFTTKEYTSNQRSAIKTGIRFYLKNKIIKSDEVSKAESIVTGAHIKIVQFLLKKHNLRSDQVDLIGFHGQTIYHSPKNKMTVQIGDAQELATKTKINVIASFRTKDVASGGEGAPLAPLYHLALVNKFRIKKPTCVLNIGGIANITWVGSNNKLIAFDTGPGNFLIDQWAQKKLGKPYDKDGAHSKKGKVHNVIIKKFLKHKFYEGAPPKSLETSNFNLNIVRKLSTKDGLATLTALTALSILKGFSFLPSEPKNLILSGGGRKNKTLVNYLKSLTKTTIFPIDDLGVDGDAVEAQAFAYLAVRSFKGKYLTLPTTTGVNQKATGGVIYTK